MRGKTWRCCYSPLFSKRYKSHWQTRELSKLNTPFASRTSVHLKILRIYNREKTMLYYYIYYMKILLYRVRCLSSAVSSSLTFYAKLKIEKLLFFCLFVFCLLLYFLSRLSKWQLMQNGYWNFFTNQKKRKKKKHFHWISEFAKISRRKRISIHLASCARPSGTPSTNT